MMTKLFTSALIILTVTIGTIWSAEKSAMDYLHSASAKYVQSRIQEASIEVEEGLAKYPQDPKLKVLVDQLKKLKDQKKKDQGGSGSGEPNPDQDKDQKKDQKDSSGQNSDSKKGQDQKDNEKDKEKDKAKSKEEDQKKKDEEKKEQEKKDQAAAADSAQNQKNAEKNGDSSGQAAAPVKPGQMSKEEAERLLNSYQDDEKREHQQMQKRNSKPVEVEKDW